MKTTLELAKVAFVFSCLFYSLPAAATPRVENGTPVAVDDKLNQSVVMWLFGGKLCSASFLTEKVLVTAAHCTAAAKIGKSDVYVRDSNGQVFFIPVSKITTHPQFQMQNTFQGAYVKNDVGLIEIDTAFPFKIRTMMIGSIDYLRLNEANVTVAGYGQNAMANGAGALRIGTMRAQVLPAPNFFNRDGVYMIPLKDQIVCPGDSGGAVLKGSSRSRTLIAVNSISNGCQNAGADSYSVSEYLSQHKSWIKKVAPSVP